MAYLRQNVYSLGGDWADPILWYARGVAAMKQRALADPTSWRFYGAIHGIDPGLWQALGYLSGTDKQPSSALIKQFWKQCQHGSWYFLPWHRGYLLAFEANVRAAVIQRGGPADWALPYWNYFKPGQNNLPPAFASPDWPDGKGDNPLFVAARYGPGLPGGSGVYVPMNQVNLLAMADPDFTGVASGGSPGFGGVDTGFSHGGGVHGGIETQPHDYVHGLVGGADPANPNMPGLMSDPDTAGLDPIFWLHHGNIDRLWAVWRLNPATHVDPTQTHWLQGPASVGERDFAMPMPDGKTWTYTPAQMVDPSALGYGYDDLNPVATTAHGANLLLRAAAAPAVLTGGPSMAPQSDVQMLGASEAAVPVTGAAVASTVRIAPTASKRLEAIRPLAPTPGAQTTPDRILLNLENVRSKADGVVFDVYVGLPATAVPKEHPQNLAGSIALFGVRKASLADDEHSGQGVTYVLDITEITRQPAVAAQIAAGALSVRLVPLRAVADAAGVTIGRISVFHQAS